MLPLIVEEEIPPHVVRDTTDGAGVLHFIMVSLHVEGQTVLVSVRVLALRTGVPYFVVTCPVVLVKVTFVRETFITFITGISYSFMYTFFVTF